MSKKQVYRDGYLPRDRGYDNKLHHLAQQYLLASDKKELHLVQRRLGERNYEYIMIPIEAEKKAA